MEAKVLDKKEIWMQLRMVHTLNSMNREKIYKNNFYRSEDYLMVTCRKGHLPLPV